MKNFFLILFTLFQIKNIFTNNKFLSFNNKEQNQEKIDKIYKLVLIRHGQSSFNQENLFTGWTDVDLTDIGVEEAKLAGKIR